MGLETLAFHFFSKEKFLPLGVPPEAWKHSHIIAYESIHISEAAGSLKNSSDAENGSILQQGACLVPDGSPWMEKTTGRYLQLFISYDPNPQWDWDLWGCEGGNIMLLGPLLDLIQIYQLLPEKNIPFSC